MENNNPPFFDGQKVVALQSAGMIVKDNVYTVGQQIRCSCGTWHTLLQELPTEGGIYNCCDCDIEIRQRRKYKGGESYRFVPVQSNYSDMTAEIVNDERYKMPVDAPDKILIPQEAN